VSALRVEDLNVSAGEVQLVRGGMITLEQGQTGAVIGPT